ncbi:MAG: gliding motility-associated protein GldE [Bacteroidia bacterium]|nr:gliding motility-associated protein GldE [Bacteroidia bacterium]
MFYFSTGTFSLIAAGFVILVLIILSALVSSAETALFSISAAERSVLKSSDERRDLQIMHLFDNSNHVLASFIIANNFFNMSIIILTAYVTEGLISIHIHPVIDSIIEVVGLTLIILLICDIIPKGLAASHALGITRSLVVFMFVIRSVFYPFASLLVLSTSFLDKYILRKKAGLSAANLSEALEITAPAIPHGQRKILRDIISFGNKDVKEIMQPRIDIIAFQDNLPFTELLKKVIDCGFSRVPIYSSSPDTITGILYTKDLIARTGESDSFNWKTLLHPPLFVPESKKINDLLEQFREDKIHLAVVVDEFGGTSGIVTMEDIVEEILGEIRDEFDEDKLIYSRLDEHNYVFEGKISLIDFCRITELDPVIFQEHKGGADTLGGFVIELAGRIPDKKEQVKFANLTFSIEAADKRTVQRIRVTL